MTGWRSVCQHCGVEMKRVGPGNWVVATTATDTPSLTYAEAPSSVQPSMVSDGPSGLLNLPLAIERSPPTDAAHTALDRKMPGFLLLALPSAAVLASTAFGLHTIGYDRSMRDPNAPVEM